jgi:hypothetical protein
MSRLLTDEQRRSLHMLREAVEYAEGAPTLIDVDEDALRDELQEYICEMIGRPTHGYIDVVALAYWMLSRDEELAAQNPERGA